MEGCPRETEDSHWVLKHRVVRCTPVGVCRKHGTRAGLLDRDVWESRKLEPVVLACRSKTDRHYWRSWFSPVSHFVCGGFWGWFILTSYLRLITLLNRLISSHFTLRTSETIVPLYCMDWSSQSYYLFNALYITSLDLVRQQTQHSPIV